ncbi:MAG: hypothetical protein ACRDJE_12850, partial [Dehalococcoidia bacterium]
VGEERMALTEDELAAFARKLDAWAGSLTERERTFLEQMLADAADAANEDISGYANLSSIVSDDVGGHSEISAVAGPVVGAVVGYARGLAGEEAEGTGGPFHPGGDSSAP